MTSPLTSSLPYSGCRTMYQYMMSHTSAHKSIHSYKGMCTDIPHALQVQHGLSCESPQTTSIGRHSPLRKGHQVFGQLLKEVDQSKEQMQAKILDLGTRTCEEVENHFSVDEEVTSSSVFEVDETTTIINLQQESQSLGMQCDNANQNKGATG